MIAKVKMCITGKILVKFVSRNYLMSQKHLGLILDNKLNFHEDLKGVLDRISKTMGLICKFQLILPRFSLLTVDKTS